MKRFLFAIIFYRQEKGDIFKWIEMKRKLFESGDKVGGNAPAIILYRSFVLSSIENNRLFLDDEK